MVTSSQPNPHSSSSLKMTPTSHAYHAGFNNHNDTQIFVSKLHAILSTCKTIPIWWQSIQLISQVILWKLIDRLNKSTGYTWMKFDNSSHSIPYKRVASRNVTTFSKSRINIRYHSDTCKEVFVYQDELLGVDVGVCRSCSDRVSRVLWRPVVPRWLCLMGRFMLQTLRWSSDLASSRKPMSVSW